jgi:hypothetical protein
MDLERLRRRLAAAELGESRARSVIGAEAVKVEELRVQADGVEGGIKARLVVVRNLIASLERQGVVTLIGAVFHHHVRPENFGRVLPGEVVCDVVVSSAGVGGWGWHHLVATTPEKLPLLRERVQQLQRQRATKGFSESRVQSIVEAVDDEIEEHPKVVAVDFDGVVHACSQGYRDGSIYDAPLPGAIAGLRQLLRRHPVFIMTARGNLAEVAAWLKTHGLRAELVPEQVHLWTRRGVLGVTNRKLPADVYVDDRAECFDTWPAVQQRLGVRLGEGRPVGQRCRLVLGDGATYPALISRNTIPGELPWRLTVFRQDGSPIDHLALASGDLAAAARTVQRSPWGEAFRARPGRLRPMGFRLVAA